MDARAFVVVAVLTFAGAELAAAKELAPRVEVVRRDSERRVDVSVDGKPFTSYIHPERYKKAMLFPIRTARGTVITRGFPLAPRSGERVDHQHHIGMWFNYGKVEGVDFWGTDFHPPEKQGDKGIIVHRAIGEARSGVGRGGLAVSADWILPGGRLALREATKFTFHAGAGRRAIDRVATLAAAGGAIRFGDTKEGMFGVRVARSLEHPDDKPTELVGPDGRPEKGKRVDNSAAGVYRSSEGVLGEKVWGTRGRWVMLTGVVEGEPVTLAILDHPKNPGHPTHWHARGYGLFAANPLGIAELSGGKRPALDFVIGKGKSARFAYRFVVLSHTARPEEIEGEWQLFAKEVK